MEKLAQKYFALRESEFICSLSRIGFYLMLIVQVVVGSSMLRYNATVSYLFFHIFLRYIGLAVILFVLLFRKTSKKELYIYFCAVIGLQILSLVTSFRAQPVYLLATALLVKEEDGKWIAKAIFQSLLFSFLVVIGLYSSGIIAARYTERWDGMWRNSLGFWHPNTAGAIFVAVLMGYLTTLKEKSNLWIILLFGAAFAITHYFSDSMTAFLLTVLLITYTLFLKIFMKFKNFLFKATLWMFNFIVPFFMIASYALSFFYNENNPIMRRISSLTTGRLGFGHVFVREYPITLLGQSLTFRSGNEVGSNVTAETFRVLDNGYLNVLLTQGLIYTVIILFIFMLIVNRMFKEGHKFMPIIGIAIAGFGVMEQSFMILPFNIILLFGAQVLNRYINSDHDFFGIKAIINEENR